MVPANSRPGNIFVQLGIQLNSGGDISTMAVESLIRPLETFYRKMVSGESLRATPSTGTTALSLVAQQLRRHAALLQRISQPTPCHPWTAWLVTLLVGHWITIYRSRVQALAGHHGVLAFGKLLTPVSLCHKVQQQAIIWYWPKAVIRSAAGKVTVNLASHWLGVWYIHGQGKRDKHLPTLLRRGMV